MELTKFDVKDYLKTPADVQYFAQLSTEDLETFSTPEQLVSYLKNSLQTVAESLKMMGYVNKD